MYVTNPNPNCNKIINIFGITKKLNGTITINITIEKRKGCVISENCSENLYPSNFLLGTIFISVPTTE